MKKIAFLLPGLPQPIGGFKFVYSLINEIQEYYPEIEINVYHQNINSNNILNRVKYFINRYRNIQRNYVDENFKISVKYIYNKPDRVFKKYDQIIISSWQLMSCNNQLIVKNHNKIKHLVMDYPGYMGSEDEIIPTWKHKINYYVISKHLQESFKKYVNRDSIYLGCKIPWTNNEIFNLTEESISRDGFLMNYSSGYYKDPKRTIKIANYLVNKGRKVTIYSREKKPQSLSASVKFYRGISEQHLAKLFKAHEYFISLSRFEGFGLPALEAMYYGCVLITTDNMGNRDYIQANINCFLLLKENQDFENIDSYINNTHENKNIVTLGRETAHKFLKIGKKSCDLLVN